KTFVFKLITRWHLEMLDEQAHLLPHSWVAGDDGMGRIGHFRRDLNARDDQYLLAVPSNTAIRDLDATPPPYGGRGSENKTLFVQAHVWRHSVGEDQWTRIAVHDGKKGHWNSKSLSVAFRQRSNGG
ncbi:MAG: transposase, partial [Planctomycetes bacterium]|nr:transposase [Planctomycetota bacterium]